MTWKRTGGGRREKCSECIVHSPRFAKADYYVSSFWLGSVGGRSGQSVVVIMPNVTEILLFYDVFELLLM